MQVTTALKKISALRKKIRVVQGGQGAGKTIAILMLICNHAWRNNDKEIIIASAELTKMRLTVIKDFVKVMKALGMYEDSRFIAGTLYRFPNGSFIKFIGLDKEDVGKGFRGDVLYVNEADKVPFESYREIASRFKHIYIDFNPNAEFWAHDHVIRRKDCDFLTLTFRDNEYLSKEERDEILLYYEQGYGVPWDPKRKEDPPVVSKYWANKWRVYGLGLVGILEGAVFENWEIIEEIPKEAELICGGIDWGWENPAAGVKIYRMDGHYYIDQLFYESHLSNEDMAQIILYDESEEEVWYADSAEPKSIQEVYDEGVNCHPCADKKDLINYAVKKLNQRTFYVTASSKETIAELHGYVWDKDSKGRPTGKPKKSNDHACNAICYGVGTEGKYDGEYR